MAAEAHNLHLVPDTLAMRAAILCIVGWNTATGRICAFLRASHSPPLPVHERHSEPGHLGYDAKTDVIVAPLNADGKAKNQPEMAYFTLNESRANFTEFPGILTQNGAKL